MPLRLRRSRIPPHTFDSLRLIAAHSAERVLSEHVRSALELIEEGAEYAPVGNLLAAYARLHHLSEQDERKLREGVLAALGRTGSPGPLQLPSSPFARLARRLRGRANPELRTWVARHTAHVELEAADLHVQGTLEAVSLLEDLAPCEQAIEAYAKLLDLRPAMAEIVRLKTLKTLYERDLAGPADSETSHTIPYPVQRAENGP